VASREFNLEVAAASQHRLFQKLERYSGMVGQNNLSSSAKQTFMRLASVEQEMRRRFISRLLPRDEAYERTGFALRQQAVPF